LANRAINRAFLQRALIPLIPHVGVNLCLKISMVGGIGPEVSL